MSPKKILSGGWEKLGVLGKGGNGDVYRARLRGVDGAHKSLRADLALKPKRRARFLVEIEAMRRCQDVGGVLKLLDSITENDKAIPWLVTEIAKPFNAVFDAQAKLIDVVGAICEISKTLSQIHDRGISHRDIKPDNLFLSNEGWAVGDFGLADFDDKENLTALYEKLGPIYYIAPEMLNNAGSSDGKAADVYSLAKTLWKLATGQRYPLPGHQLAYLDVFSISSYVNHPRARLLNPLLELATDPNPSVRPSMAEFSMHLQTWLNSHEKAQVSPGVLNLGEYVQIVDEIKQKNDADEAARNAKAARRSQLNEQWINPIGEVVNGLIERMKSAGLSGTKLYRWPDSLNCHATLNCDVPGWSGSSSTFTLTVAFYADDAPRCLIKVIALGQGSGQSESYLNKDFSFLAEGVDFGRVAEVNDYIESNIQDVLIRFIGRATQKNG